MATFGTSTLLASGPSKQVTWGATVAVGDTVYLDTATDTYKLADGDSSAATALGAGVAVSGGVTGSPGIIATAGARLSGCSGLVPGQIYCVGSTAGSIEAHSALTEDTDYVSIVAVALTSSTAIVILVNSGVLLNLA